MQINTDEIVTDAKIKLYRKAEKIGNYLFIAGSLLMVALFFSDTSLAEALELKLDPALRSIMFWTGNSLMLIGGVLGGYSARLRIKLNRDSL